MGAEAEKADTLASGFAKPPQSAAPRAWWHWMNGNITQEGIKLDLEWMKRIGIGGFQTFDASLGTPQVVEKRLVFMTPEWKEAFSFATTLADKLHLEMGIAGSPGWSESGGPCAAPAQAMKKIVWSETTIAEAVKVTNLWVNRLIGDAQPDTTHKYTFTTQAFYKADSPLLPSGLLGPVQLLRERRGS